MALYFKTNQTEFKTVSDVLDEFYEYNQYSDLKAKATYKDSELKQIHCYNNKVRSFDDLKEIVETYIPDITDEEVVEGILSYTRVLSKDPENGKCYSFYAYHCNDINKITVYYLYDYSVASGFGSDNDDLLDKKWENSARTWRQVLAVIGIKNSVVLQAYINDVKQKHKENVLSSCVTN